MARDTRKTALRAAVWALVVCALALSVEGHTARSGRGKKALQPDVAAAKARAAKALKAKMEKYTATSVLEHVTHEKLAKGTKVINGKTAVSRKGTDFVVSKYNGEATPKAKRIAKTLDTLGGVLKRMHRQVLDDEKVFNAFKEKLLENEVDKAHVDLSWPAIKQLVKTEVKVGRQSVQNQVAKFKVDVLQVVQRGLDALRADLRASITEGLLADLKLKKKEVSKKGKKLITVDADEVSFKKKGATNKLDEFLKSLKLPKKDKADIRTYVKQKVHHREPKLDNYGVTAMRALKEMESALAGRVSMKDLRSEIFTRLRMLTRAYLQNPTPAGKAALKSLRTHVLTALERQEARYHARKAKQPTYQHIRSPIKTKLPHHAPVYPPRRSPSTQTKRAVSKVVRKALRKSTQEVAAEIALAKALKAVAKEKDVSSRSDKIAKLNKSVNADTRSVTRNVVKTLKQRSHPVRGAAKGALLEEEAELRPQVDILQDYLE